MSAVLITRDRSELALEAIDSLTAADVSMELVVLDNNSAPEHAAGLAAGCATRTVQLIRSERNLGTAGGRQWAAERTRGDFVLYLDDDAVLEPGALEHLVDALEADPALVAAGATVLLPDGTVFHSGGWLGINGALAEFRLIGAGGQPEELPASGPAGWLPGTAVLIRRPALSQVPISAELHRYFEDNDWCLRAARHFPGGFWRSTEARVLHRFSPKHGPEQDFASRSAACELLGDVACFYRRHRLILTPALFDLAPQLVDDDGERDLVSARLLLELVLARGTDWLFAEWMSGGLEPLLADPEQATARRQTISFLRRQLAGERQRVREQEHHLLAQNEAIEFLRRRHQTLERVEAGGWWRLRGRLLPAIQLAHRARAAVSR